MSTEDFTARARIRDAAIRLFTERGMEKTSILDIAKEAGVSGGLIRHHFGSKDGLREVCDAYVYDELLKFKMEALEKGSAGFLPTFDARQLLLRRYLGRAMIDGSAAAARQFAEIVDETEAYFRAADIGGPDPRGTAAALVAMTGGLFVFHGPMADVLGETPNTHEATLRIMAAAGHLLTHPLAGTEMLDKAREALSNLDSRERNEDG
ncbi:TetR/AcrR family transcriptional regulator [Amycolatopsis balhimycina DSM 5908]|uniref:TetR/AcrR family transcriptional regulator n=1 Tax=Amycolatopsis balhimycina DSM 5908 TaxID=1081091 RepID=A0A428W621_AMYBA|nr:TetR/AcrR family transcriptional regulator [Amycolatopsis balhimycina]RSM38526.1 TetR/AcrR family transcriptional regulator [Amycolatopsis balhimycina DSM 5908]